jgi:hypothetical protein
MSDTPRDDTRAAVLAEELRGRIRATAAELSEAATQLTARTPPAGGYTAAATALRPVLAILIDHSALADLYAGPGIAAVAAALGVTEATARRRYARGPRDLPLIVTLYPADPLD